MKKSERSSRKKIDYKKMASGLSPVTEVKEKEKSKIAEVTAPAGASIADKLSEPKDTSTPVKLTLPVNPGDEKSSLLNKLAELDKKQKQLQEKKELETLRKQVEEREEAVRELEKSLTEPVRKGKSKESSSGESGGAKPKKHKSRLAASFQEGQTPSTSTESGQSGTSLLNIDTLRQMPNLREQVRKELKKLGLEIADSSSSSTDSSSDSDSSEDEIDDTVVEQVLKRKKHKKHKTKSGITSKSSDSVKNKQKYPHSNLRYDFVSRNISFEKIEFNLFIAGELEIITSTKTGTKEKEARLKLLKKLMYLNSSYEFSVVKSLYAAVLREIELGHSQWGDDFQYVESTVLPRYKVRYSRNPEPVSLRPKPFFELPQESTNQYHLTMVPYIRVLPQKSSLNFLSLLDTQSMSININ